ncbi:hypothetical protein Ddc_04142 [Ditylenchus destructor]|nr:hypothetical protein Ddc_04142 [Ditylenchus destructor]
MNIIQRPTCIFSRQLTRSLLGRKCLCHPQRRYLSEANSISQSAQSTASQQRLSDTSLPIMKTSLLKADRTLSDTMPGLFNTSLPIPQDLFTSDVHYEDKIRGYDIRGLSRLIHHVSKMRIYFSLKSHYNKIECQGSAIHENLNYLTMVYRFETLPFNLILQIVPVSLIPKRWRPDYLVIEGALDFYINVDGHVFKIVNREVTENDRLIAEHMASMKKIEEEEQAQLRQLEKLKQESQNQEEKPVERKSKFQKYL